MKRNLLVSTAALGIAILPLGAVQAQDAFEGGYVGLHAGYFTGSVNADAEEYYFGGPIDGFIAGVLAGYNFPHKPGGNVMFGVEGDFGWANVTGSGNAMTMADGCLAVIREVELLDCSVEIYENYPYKMNWDAHLWGRALFGQGNVRPFVKAGLALGNLQVAEYTGTFAGVSVGGGIDALVGNNLLARFEAFYDWYCDKEIPYEAEEVGTVNWSGLTARVAVIFKFGGA